MAGAPRASTPVNATVTVPGSKSQTNRTLVLAALAAAQGQGASTIAGALRSRDTDLMIGALQHPGPARRRDRIRPAGQRPNRTRRERAQWTAAWRERCCVSCRPWRRWPSRWSSSTATSRPGPGRSHHCWMRCAVSASASTAPVCRSGSSAADRSPAAASRSTRRRHRSSCPACCCPAASFTDGLTVQHTGSSLPSAPHIAMTVAMLRAGRSRRRRLDAQPLAGASRHGRRPALGGRTRPDERGCLPGGRRGHRRRGAHHRVAADQRASQPTTS